MCAQGGPRVQNLAKSASYQRVSLPVGLPVRHDVPMTRSDVSTMGSDYEAPAVTVLGRLDELTLAFSSGGANDIFCPSDWVS